MLKSKHPQAQLIVDDLAAVVHMAIAPSGEEGDMKTMELVAIEDAQAIEAVLANNAFLHGVTYVHDMTAALSVVHSHLSCTLAPRNIGRDEV